MARDWMHVLIPPPDTLDIDDASSVVDPDQISPEIATGPGMRPGSDELASTSVPPDNENLTSTPMTVPGSDELASTSVAQVSEATNSTHYSRVGPDELSSAGSGLPGPVDVGIDADARLAGWTPHLAVLNDQLREVFAQVLERLSNEQTYPARGDDEQLARLLEGALLVPELERLETLSLRAQRELVSQEIAQPVTRQDAHALQAEVAEIDAVLATREAEQLTKLDGLAEHLKASNPQIQDVTTRRIGDMVEIWAEVSTTEWVSTSGDGIIDVSSSAEIKVATYDLGTEQLTTRNAQSERRRDEASFHSFMLGVGAGDFSDNNSWTAAMGRGVGGLLPISDARDIAAGIVHVREGREGAWGDLLLSVVALLPLLGDLAKAEARAVNATDDVLSALSKEAGVLSDAGQTLLQAIAKTADDAFADAVGAGLSPASAIVAEAVETLSGPQKLLSRFAGRLVNESGALEGIFRRMAPGVLNNVDRRAAAAELRHLVEQLNDPDVLRVQAIRSTNKTRTPDLLVEYSDGTSKVIEVTAATFAPAYRKEKVILHGELVRETAERAEGFQQAIEAGITRKLDTPKRASQLRYPVEGVARPGELIVDTLVFNSRARELAEEAVANLESRLAGADYLGRIQINYLTRSVDDELIHHSVSFVRRDGRYVLSK